MEACHPTLVHSITSLISLVNECCVPLASTVLLLQLLQRIYLLVVVPPVKLSTVGSRDFPVTAAKLWNSLPDDIVLADSLSTFRRQLKHYLYQQLYLLMLYCDCCPAVLL